MAVSRNMANLSAAAALFGHFEVPKKTFYSNLRNAVFCNMRSSTKTIESSHKTWNTILHSWMIGPRTTSTRSNDIHNTRTAVAYFYRGAAPVSRCVNKLLLWRNDRSHSGSVGGVCAKLHSWMPIHQNYEVRLCLSLPLKVILNEMLRFLCLKTKLTFVKLSEN